MAMNHFNTRMAAKLVAAAGLVYLSFAAAQPPAQLPGAQPQPGGRPPTLEERVAALERGLASVTTRFEIRESAVPPSQSGVQNAAAFESRVSSLERSIVGLQQQLQSVQRAADSAQRAADSASRDAGDARRTAQAAESTARDALLRAH
jgi:hypothetical protein